MLNTSDATCYLKPFGRGAGHNYLEVREKLRIFVP